MLGTVHFPFHGTVHASTHPGREYQGGRERRASLSGIIRGSNPHPMDGGGAEAGTAAMRASTTLVLLMRELKVLWVMVLPITAMNLVVFVRYMISIFFLGRLGSLELAGGALALGFTTISGYSVLFGLACGLEPICSQADGSKNWDLTGLSLHRMIMILLLASLPIAFLWLNTSKIMHWASQDPEIAAIAASYCLYSLPILALDAVLLPIQVFLRSHGLTKPLMYCALATLMLDVPLNVLFVFVFKLGVAGVAIAAELGDLNMGLLLFGYLYLSRFSSSVFSWRGWRTTVELHQLRQLLALAVSSCAGVCLEWWCYEMMTVLSGYLPNPRVTVATAAILMQTINLTYCLSMALGSCASTRVGNELGSGAPNKARIAAIVALGCSFLFGIFNVLWTRGVLGRKWAAIFTHDASVLALTASAMPILGFSELCNGVQTTGFGVLRGMARTTISMGINLVSFYALGTPLAILLAFWFDWGCNGIWFGLLTAEAACALSSLFAVIRTNWEVEALPAKNLASIGIDHFSRNLMELEQAERTGLLIA